MLYIGTTSPGKIAEIAALLSPLQIDIQTVSLDVPETTDDFDGNAMQKAMAYASHTGGITLCEDSGLIVPALGGLPGPWSAHFDDCTLVVQGALDEKGNHVPKSFRVRSVKPSGRPREILDKANNETVLDLLEDVRQPGRAAYFVVVLIVRDGNRTLFRTRRECHGWIAEESRGTEGFGYDPIFIGEDTFGKTFAELDPARKNLRSHRKKAMDELFVWASQNRTILARSHA